MNNKQSKNNNEYFVETKNDDFLREIQIKRLKSNIFLKNSNLTAKTVFNNSFRKPLLFLTIILFLEIERKNIHSFFFLKN